jgi:uncharacterized protein
MNDISPDPERLPLFPLQTVLFPGGELSLRIFEPRYLDLVRDCLKSGTGFGVVAIKSGREAGTAATPFPIGTYAEIVDWSQGADGFLTLALKGSLRFQIRSHSVMPNQLIVGAVTWLDKPRATASPERSERLNQLLKALCEKMSPTIDVYKAPAGNQIAYRVAELLPLPLSLRYELLCMESDLAQIELVEDAIQRVVRPPK